MNDVFIFDACALIAFLADEEGSERVQQILQKAREKKCLIKIHQINILEIYYGIYREDGEETAKQVLKTIQALPIQIIDTIDHSILHEAGRLKASYRLSLADAIAVASAISFSGVLVSSDHHELGILEKNNEVDIEWIRPAK